MKKKLSGIWLFGLSGSGKTYISRKIGEKIKKNTVIIDGDKVRSYISTDLGYSKKERKIQIKRVFGISKIIKDSKMFPISSTVYFDKELKNRCEKIGILPIRIVRKNFKKVLKKHKTYKNKTNVVGKDIKYEKFNTKKIFNNDTIQPINKIINIMKNYE